MLAAARARAPARATSLVAVAFGVALGTMNWAIYEAMDRIPIGVAVTIEFAGPLGLAVALSRRALDLVWVALAAAGILLLTNPFGASDLDAAGVALRAARGGRVGGLHPDLRAHGDGCSRAAAGLAIAMVVGALLVAPAGIAQGGAELLEPALLAAGAVVALASSVIPYSLELESLRRIPARVFGVLMSLEPAVAALAGFVVLGQALGSRPGGDRAGRGGERRGRRTRLEGYTRLSSRWCTRASSRPGETPSSSRSRHSTRSYTRSASATFAPASSASIKCR